MPSVLTDANKAFLTKFPTRGDVEVGFSPQKWGYALANPSRAYMADCPTLADYNAMYGVGASADWVYMQVLALFGASSSKDKEQVDAISIFASNFSQEAKRYKLSELMLFFGRYKAGRYDNSYTTFDTKRIGNAFFNEFLPQRRVEIDIAEREQQQKESMKRRELPEGYSIPQGYNPYTWYVECMRRKGIKPLSLKGEIKK